MAERVQSSAARVNELQVTCHCLTGTTILLLVAPLDHALNIASGLAKCSAHVEGKRQKRFLVAVDALHHC
jgi:hypothetical protein